MQGCCEISTPDETTQNTALMSTTKSSDVPEELVDKVETFLSRYYREDILKLAERTSDPDRALHIDWGKIYQYDPDVADDFLNNPETVLSAIERAVKDFDSPVPVGDVNVRVINLNDAETFDVGDYRSRHIGDYVGVEAQVQQVTEVTPTEVVAVFECQRCGAITEVPQSEDSDFQEPYQCTSCERDGPFKLDKDATEWNDLQKAKLQKPPSRSAADGTGATLEAVLRDEDLVGDLAPGDRINMFGPLSVREQDGSHDYLLESNGYQRENQDFDDVDISEYRDAIEEIANGERGSLPEVFVESLAPNIFGYDQIKLAVTLQFFAQDRVQLPDGSSQRGSIHILILGDPGCGKSDILSHATDIAPRSVMASGDSSTGVGFTASVTPDDFGSGKWSLEGGAMVLADGGLACIDELDKAAAEDREKLHVPMEQQKVLISKASFSGVELNARSSVLAAGNPKYGRFDKYENIADQIELSPTLMSRFDLMFMVQDEPDEEHDRALAEQAIGTRQAGIQYETGDRDAVDEPPISVGEFRAYVAYARQNVTPRIEDDDVKELLRDFYVDLRQLNEDSEDSPVPVTVRKLGALQRLAEASARMRLSETVEKEDAKRAMSLVRKAMEDVGKDPESGEYDADVVETGRSKTQQERIRGIKSIVEELQVEMQTVPHDEVVTELEDRGFDVQHIEKSIEDLKKQGELYEPDDDGRYRTL